MNTHLIPFYSLFNCFFFFLYQYYKQFQAIPCFSICSSQQEFGFSTTFHTAFGFLILLLLTLLQVKYQIHGATMSLFIIVVLVYAIALAGISQPSSNRIYLPIPSILGRVCFIFRAFACDLLLLILVRSLWMAHPHFMCMHVCTITLRLILTDSPMLSTNFPIDKSIYFKGIQNIVWLVPKQFQIVVSSSF